MHEVHRACQHRSAPQFVLSAAAIELLDFQNRNISMSAPAKHGQGEQGTIDHQFRCDQEREQGCSNGETLMLLLALQNHILIFCRIPFLCRHTLRAKNTLKDFQAGQP